MVSQALRPILVVDDDADIRAAIHEALADLGYEVYEAPGGKPALERLQASERGMVVLVDYRMPGMNGIQMIQTIAAHDDLALRHTCVLVTAHYDSLPHTVVTLLQSFGVSVLAKPFDLNDLVVAVQAGERALDGGARTKPIPSDADTGGFLNTQM
jgi:CheY-like chemotaxis protein